MKYYTIFEEGELLLNCTDDMNTTEDWATSGLLFNNFKDAEDCKNHWIEYWDGEGTPPFQVVEVVVEVEIKERGVV